VNAAASVIAMGCAAQLLSGWLTATGRLPGLSGPVLTCFAGAGTTAAMYLVEPYTLAVGLLYATWLVGEGGFVGTLTFLQTSLPAGRARDGGLGLFFASSVLLGAADVFLMSQAGIGSAFDTLEDDGDDRGGGGGDDGGGGGSGSGDDDAYAADPGASSFWCWLLKGRDHNAARCTMLAGVSAMYAVSGLVFLFAACAPRAWPCHQGAWVVWYF